MVLLTPGPCMTSDRVRAAASAQDMNHRDPAFLGAVKRIKRRLVNVQEGAESWMPYLIGGSGTAAMEAMLGSMVAQGPVLVVTNGYYSERMADILQALGIPHDVLRYGWLETTDDDRLASTLSSKAYEAVVLTHHETTTGRLNPIAVWARQARASGCRVLVDAMSSFGADDLHFSDVDAVCSSANKCLHGIPGVSFVLVRPGFEFAEPRGYYLHLPRYAGDDPPLTPPVPAMLALDVALEEFEEQGGRRARKQSYLRKGEAVREALQDLRCDQLQLNGSRSCTLGVFRAPQGWSAPDWIDANRKSGYLLYGCKGELREDWFQLSVMGETTVEDIENWHQAARKLV